MDDRDRFVAEDGIDRAETAVAWIPHPSAHLFIDRPIPRSMRNLVMISAMLALLSTALFVPGVAADDDDPPLADCRRVLFLHWVDYSHHYACVDQDGDIQDGECTVGYKRQAPDGNSETCIV